MNLKNKIVIFIIVTFALLAACVLIFYSTNESDNYNDYTENENLENEDNEYEENGNENLVLEKNEVTNYGRYFSLVTTVNQIYNNIYSNNVDNLLSALSINYINTNQINSGNIENFIEFKNDYYTATINDIKEVYIYDSIGIYFVEVSLVLDAINFTYDMSEKYTEYIVIFYDENNLTYSFMPINIDEFNEESLIKDDENYLTEYIMSNGSNSYSVKSVSNSMIADLYYYKLYFNYFNEIDGYENLLSGSLPNDFYIDGSSSIVQYYYNDSDSVLEIVDSNDFYYYFTINSVLDFKVKIS